MSKQRERIIEILRKKGPLTVTEIRAIAKKQKKPVGANPGSTRNTMWYRDTSRLRPEFRFDKHSKKYSLSGTVKAAKSISISGGPISFQAVKNFLARNGITVKKSGLIFWEGFFEDRERVPESSGVYLFYDKKKTKIMYVGQTGNLRQRIGNQEGGYGVDHTECKYEYIGWLCVSEARLNKVECMLYKKYQPKCNKSKPPYCE